MTTHAKIPYWQQLQNPQWQKKRLEILKRANFKCECCDNSEDTLSIHHRYYQKGLMAWQYPDEALVCVCSECHEAIADAERLLLRPIMPKDILNMYDLASCIHDLTNLGVGITPICIYADKLFKRELRNQKHPKQ